MFKVMWPELTHRNTDFKDTILAFFTGQYFHEFPENSRKYNHESVVLLHLQQSAS